MASYLPRVMLIYVRDVTQLVFAAIHPARSRLIARPSDLSIDSAEESARADIFARFDRFLRSTLSLSQIRAGTYDTEAQTRKDAILNAWIA